MNKIYYRSGYKYQISESYSTDVVLRPDDNITSEFIQLSVDGLLTMKKGYAWDGPSGPTFDTKSFMRGSLVHDALYQLMRYEYLPGTCREDADQELHRMCREDGMNAFRAWYILKAIRSAAGFAASPESKKKVKVAP